jgi:hypothetical protein
MTVRFNAVEYRTLEEDGVLSVAFAGEEDRYVLLQRSIFPSDQDVALGMDAPYLEVSDQASSGYGKILQCVLHHDRIVIRTDGSLPDAEVAFAVDRQALSSLRTSLQRIFAGHECFKDDA